MAEKLKLNVFHKARESGPVAQKMERVGSFGGIDGYMDTSGEFAEGVCQPCQYTKYLTYNTVASTGLPGEACIFCFPFWGFEFVCLKVLPQWSTCLGTCIQNGLVGA